MTNTVESVKQLIREAVEKATGWPTIFGPTDGPQPANQYCLLTLRGIETKERDVHKYTQTEENLTEHQRQESTINFEIQARGKGAMEKGHDIVAYLDSDLRDIDLWGSVGSGGHDDVQNISTYQNGKILPLALLNIYIHTALSKQNVIEFMKYLDITTKIGNNNSITITVPKEEES